MRVYDVKPRSNLNEETLETILYNVPIFVPSQLGTNEETLYMFVPNVSNFFRVGGLNSAELWAKMLERVGYPKKDLPFPSHFAAISSDGTPFEPNKREGGYR